MGTWGGVGDTGGAGGHRGTPPGGFCSRCRTRFRGGFECVPPRLGPVIYPWGGVGVLSAPPRAPPAAPSGTTRPQTLPAGAGRAPSPPPTSPFPYFPRKNQSWGMETNGREGGAQPDGDTPISISPSPPPLFSHLGFPFRVPIWGSHLPHHHRPPTATRGGRQPPNLGLFPPRGGHHRTLKCPLPPPLIP